MIVAAALRIDGVTYSMPKPARHADLIGRLGMDGEQGFLTSSGTFAHRRLAHRIAFKAGQVATMDGELFSEDLW
jgi:hypothetical protein